MRMFFNNYDSLSRVVRFLLWILHVSCGPSYSNFRFPNIVVYFVVVYFGMMKLIKILKSTIFLCTSFTEANGIKPAVSSSYVPVCQKTVTYIVAAILINEHDEVLMMQEAKSSCLGKWYLPAGRVEANENLIDAVKREVLEETGLLMDPKSLIMVECASGSWFRFVMTGNIIGGSLKTPDQSNEESLQASWVREVTSLQLRSSDILTLIQRGRDFLKKVNGPWHSYVLPVERARNKLYLRLIVCIKKKAT